MDWVPLAGAVATVFVAIVSGVFAVLGSRAKNKADFQTAINGGFIQLISEHRKDFEISRAIMKELKQTIESQEELIERLEDEKRQQARRIADLEEFIKRNGLPIPEGPDKPIRAS